MRKVKYIRPTHLNRMTGERIEVLKYSANGSFMEYYDSKGDYHSTPEDILLDYLELNENEKKIQICKK